MASFAMRGCVASPTVRVYGPRRLLRVVWPLSAAKENCAQLFVLPSPLPLSTGANDPMAIRHSCMAPKQLELFRVPVKKWGRNSTENGPLNATLLLHAVPHVLTLRKNEMRELRDGPPVFLQSRCTTNHGKLSKPPTAPACRCQMVFGPSQYLHKS